MNFNSIITRITLFFLIAFLFLIALFFFLLKYEKNQKYEEVKNYHKNLTNYLHQIRLPRYELISYLETIDFKKIDNVEKILFSGKEIYSKRGFDTFVFGDKFYLHFKTPRFRILLEDKKDYENTYISYFIFSFGFVFLSFMYFWLLKSLRPLKKLKDDILKFSKGDLEISSKSSRKDEIAQVANEFDNSVKKIKLLLDSRQLFLRTVMHELKTPIAKGRIVSELITEEKQKNRMINIFEKLDFLINDFAKVEQVVSKNYSLEKRLYTVEDILSNSISLLMLENEKKSILKNFDTSIKIEVDFDLLSLVFKNLIDNALKYSSDKKVEIQEEKNKLIFISKGNKLEKEFEDYFEPFHNSIESKNHGMGLGLYIVKSILDIHGFDFRYEFLNEENHFIIVY